MVFDWLDRQAEFEKEVGGYFKAGKVKHKETGRERNRPSGGRVPWPLPRAERRQDGGGVGLGGEAPEIHETKTTSRASAGRKF